MPRSSKASGRQWRNVTLVRERDVRRTRWLWGLLLGIAAAAAPFTFYLIQQMDYVRVRYRIEELRNQHDRLVELEQRLRIERASLETPSRVEKRAVRDLRLVQPSPYHVVVVRRPAPGRGSLMARAPDQSE